MAWTVDIAPRAEKSLGKLGSVAAKRVAAGLYELATYDDPRLRGQAMAGRYAGHWRYRIGDYRAIAKIEDSRLIILVIEIGHRREVYR